jgi:hypothetical protein
MHTAVAQRNRALDAVTVRLNNGYIRIYDGAQPATADTALSGQTLAAELRFGATAFAAASGGSAVANAITDDSSANATTTVTWARLLESDGTTVVADVTVGPTVPGTSEINFVTVAFVTGLIVRITSLTLTQPDGTP